MIDGGGFLRKKERKKKEKRGKSCHDKFDPPIQKKERRGKGSRVESVIPFPFLLLPFPSPLLPLSVPPPPLFPIFPLREKRSRVEKKR